MDRNERNPDSVVRMLAAFQGFQSELWTALPCKVESYDADKQTVNLTPQVQVQLEQQDATKEWVSLPVLQDCPVLFPTGGGFTLTFPIEAGDECLAVFGSRCIDNWWANAENNDGPKTQAELRMHSLSDAFAVFGPRNQQRLLPDVSMTDVQLRSDANTAVISIRANSEVYVHSDANVIVDADGDVSVQAGGDVNVTAGGDLVATVSGDAAVTATTIHLTGAVTITGDLIVTGQTNTGGLDVALDANFHGAMVDVRTGKDTGGTHEHPYDGHSSGSYTTGGIV